jgi:alkylated DNA repair dioxygenase AlkB
MSIDTPEIDYIPEFLTNADSSKLLEFLQTKISWQQGKIKLFGKVHSEPRLSSWIGDPEAVYTYAGKQMKPDPWLTEIESLRQFLQFSFPYQWNSVLLNLYRDGHDYMGFHADNEPTLGSNPVIASLSLGAKRRFVFKNRLNAAKHELMLEHGSLLIMSGETQRDWLHALPKSLRVKTPRINLTFRKIHFPGFVKTRSRRNHLK